MITKTAEGIHVIEGDGWISKWVAENKRLDHDQNALPIITRYIPIGGVVVDGGANIGSHTVAYLNTVGDNGAVYAFEPNPEAYRCLINNCPRAYTHQLALGSHLHLSALEIDPHNPGASHLSKDPFYEPTVVVPLDAWQLPQLDFVKLDLEGGESAALVGAADTIRRCKPIMVIEVNAEALLRQGSNAGELLEMVTTFGYEYRNIYPRQETSGPMFDILCTPIPTPRYR